jgi:hypothetical protein
MATVGGTNATLLDVAKRMDPDGRISAIAELLSQENELLTDMPWIEGNLPTGHVTTVRTGLPEVAWRKLNQGVPASKSTTAQITEACGMLEAFGQVDKDLAELNGNTAAFRLSENMAFMESLNQTMSTTLFYGDTAVNPERFLGMAPRYTTGVVATAANGQNIISAGGSNNLTSIWLVGWGPNSIHGIYPKGSVAGLQHEDLGLETVQDAQGRNFRAYQDRYQWKCGLALRDWRYVVRIANIDVTSLEAGTTAAPADPDLLMLMVRALERIHSLSGVTPVFYANRTVRSFLRQQAIRGTQQSTLTYDELSGRPVLSFGGVPVRRVDSILSTETVVPMT